MSYNVNEKGFYGDFGGAFIPEMLYANIEELRLKYLEISETESFQKEFRQLLRDFAGRPTPLYFAERLSQKHNTTSGVPLFLDRISTDCTSQETL